MSQLELTCEFVMIFSTEKLEVVGSIGSAGIGRELGLEWDRLLSFITSEFSKGSSLVVTAGLEGLRSDSLSRPFPKLSFPLFEFSEYSELPKSSFDIWHRSVGASKRWSGFSESSDTLEFLSLESFFLNLLRRRR